MVLTTCPIKCKSWSQSCFLLTHSFRTLTNARSPPNSLTFDWHSPECTQRKETNIYYLRKVCGISFAVASSQFLPRLIFLIWFLLPSNKSRKARELFKPYRIPAKWNPIEFTIEALTSRHLVLEWNSSPLVDNKLKSDNSYCFDRLSDNLFITCGGGMESQSHDWIE